MSDRLVANFNPIQRIKTNQAWIWNLQFHLIWAKAFPFSNLTRWYLYKDVYEHNLKLLPGPLQHLCTSVTLICSKVYCPHHVHLHSSLFFSSSISSTHPTTKSRDDPSVPLFLWPSPPSGCFLFQNPLRVKPPAAVMGEGMKMGDVFCLFLFFSNMSWLCRKLKMWPWADALLKRMRWLEFNNNRYIRLEVMLSTLIRFWSYLLNRFIIWNIRHMNVWLIMVLWCYCFMSQGQ